VPTGFSELDELTNGLHPGQMVIVAARPGCGKALALDTRLPTPTGWTTMGEVAVGDQLLGSDGRPTTVVAATDVLPGRPCHRVTFSDGTSVVADEEHLWRASSRAARRAAADRMGPGSYFTTTLVDRVARLAAGAEAAGEETYATMADLVASVGAEFRSVLHTIGREVGPAVAVLTTAAGEDRQLRRVVYPRTRMLRVLADRISRPERLWSVVTHAEVLTTGQLADGVQLRDGRSNWAVGLAEPLVLPAADLAVDPYALGVRLGTGHGAQSIPVGCLRASAAQRQALLAGLLDGAGIPPTARQVRLAVASPQTAADIAELAATLGYGPVVEPGPDTAPATPEYVVSFVRDDQASPDEHRGIKGEESDPPANHRYVVDVQPVPSVPVRCVRVDNIDHTYLVTEAMIPTHNSTLALDLARSASIKNGLTSVIFSLEMSQIEITMRLLSAEAQIPLGHIRGGRMSDDDWSKVASKMGQVSEAPLYIDDSPNLTMMEIRAKARRLKQRHDLKLVVIDYIQLMTSGKRVESRQLEVSEFSRQIKLLAKELEVPVVALSQLNRGPEQRTDKRPMLSDLRESGSLEQDADMVILLNRPDLYDKESDRAGEADFDVAKHRNGPTKIITVAFQGHYSRFADMMH
jgi:replicative DNA helicase